MLKDQKGITIVALSVTIIVMLIIVSVSFVSGRELLDSSKIKGYITTMYLVKGEVQNMYESYEFNSDDNSLKGKKLDIDDTGVYTKINQIYENEILNTITNEEEKTLRKAEISEKNVWYILEKDVVNELGIETDMLDKGEVFIVNYKAGVIIYSKGYNNKEKTIYSLEGLLNLD